VSLTPHSNEILLSENEGGKGGEGGALTWISSPSDISSSVVIVAVVPRVVDDRLEGLLTEGCTGLGGVSSF